ncbi:MAG: 4-hydroxy-3-methylbut-2-en-1-yl diphosphate synthase, partial [Rhodospirillales bacterium]|nr:4-hydroxy-3-methylbut-2-en-1-yl diphosphate synthase [Rhodospirillales bacterium]
MISPGQASAPPERRRSRPIQVGPVTVGGDAPISVQSMTNTPKAD